jgi:hypothetical protein
MVNNNNSTKQLSDMCKYCDFNHLCKDPTHKRGGLIDLCLIGHIKCYWFKLIIYSWVVFILRNFAISTFSCNIKVRKETTSSKTIAKLSAFQNSCLHFMCFKVILMWPIKIYIILHLPFEGNTCHFHSNFEWDSNTEKLVL